MGNNQYFISASNQNSVYSYLSDMAQNHDDEVKVDGEAPTIPTELTYTDYQMQIDAGKDVGIHMTERLSGSNIFDPRYETLRQAYALLRTCDTEDGQLDGVITGDLLKIDLTIDLNPTETNQLTTDEIEKKYFYSVFELHLNVDHPEQEFFGTAFVTDVIDNRNGSHTYYLITNHHVVNKPLMEEISIDLVSRNSILHAQAEIVGVDALADVAVISVTFKDSELNSSIGQETLTPIVWGDSSTVQNGDKVISIGNTKGLGVILATGQVNAAITGKTRYSFPVMQTDAATNNGNSGCPILDMSGQLVGLHFYGDRDTGVLLGYEIPVDRVKATYKNILAHRNSQAAVHGYWGIFLTVLSKDLQDNLFRGKNIQGATISSVATGSPADLAGIQPGDILLTEQRVYESSRKYLLNAPMFDSAKGDKIKLRIWRDGQIIDVEFVADEMSYGIADAFHTEKGFTVCDLLPDEREQGKITLNGVRVVLDNSEENWIGDLNDNVLITQINGKDTPNVQTFRKYWQEAMQNRKDTPIVLTIYHTALDFDIWGRVGSSSYVSIKK